MKAAAIGMFDGVHRGHCALVQNVVAHAASVGATPALFTFDRHPMELIMPDNAPKLLTPLAEKKALLQQAGAHDVVVLAFDPELRSLTAKQFMQRLRDDYGVGLLVLGFNHRFGSDRHSDFDIYKQIGHELGIRVEMADELSLPGIDGTVCSSQIRQALAHGHIEKANAMLGRPYSFEGTVAHGKEIGRTIGFPTANVVPAEPRQLVPGKGAYAAQALLDGNIYPAMVNIGVRPTINADGEAATIEANIIGFDNDIYDKNIRLQFLQRLRDEQKFDSIEALAKQLADDRDRTLDIYNEILKK